MPAPGDLIHQQSTSTGTGNITLSVVNGKRTFNDEFGTGGTNKFDYFISNQAAAEWERGTGHLSASTTLVRDTVLASSNANAAVSFSAGTKDIANDVPAALQVRGPGSATVGNIALWDSSAGNLLNDAGYAPREVLTANRTYYVRTDGSDSNNGLANTSGGAFLTIQKAVDAVAALDISIYDVTIKCGPGTRTAPVTLKKLTGSGTASLEGDVTTPSNCTQSVTGGQCFTMEPGAIWKMRGFKLSTTTSGYPISCSATGCGLTLDGNMEFGAAASYHIVVSTGGSCKMTSSYTISASATNHILVQTGGILFYTPGAVTLSGSPAWSAAFISVTSGGLVSTAGATFTGAATGKRFDATLNGVINTFGGGANYFPGNVAGTATTGQYA